MITNFNVTFVAVMSPWEVANRDGVLSPDLFGLTDATSIAGGLAAGWQNPSYGANTIRLTIMTRIMLDDSPWLDDASTSIRVQGKIRFQPISVSKCLLVELQ